jgi:hypothetical protein
MVTPLKRNNHPIPNVITSFLELKGLLTELGEIFENGWWLNLS